MMFRFIGGGQCGCLCTWWSVLVLKQNETTDQGQNTVKGRSNVTAHNDV